MTCLVAMWILDDENMFDCMIYVVSSSLPFLLHGCDCMWLFFLAMIIDLVDGSRWVRFSWSAREWRFSSLAIWVGVILFMISLGLRPLYRLMLSYSTLFVRIVSDLCYLCWHRGVPGCRSCVKDLKTTLLYFIA